MLLSFLFCIKFYLFSLGLILFSLTIYEVIFTYHNNPYKIKYDEYMLYGFICCIIKIIFNFMHAFVYLIYANKFKMHDIDNLYKQIYLSEDNKYLYLLDIILYVTYITGFILYVCNYNTGPFKNILLIEIIKFIVVNSINNIFLLNLYYQYIYM